jgi:hypothetical protein
MGMSEWGMLGMYNDGVRAGYTTIQRLYRQTQDDGDEYLFLPQDRCNIKQKVDVPNQP